MNETDTKETTHLFRFSVSLVFLSLTCTSILISFSYFIICFKALKKTLHNLLILTLCLSDVVFGISLCLVILSSLFKTLSDNVAVCIFQMFMLQFGLLFNYTTLTLLCLHRYILLKTYFFGNTLEKHKFKIVIGAVLLVLIYRLLTSLVIPWRGVVSSCDTTVYGNNYHLFSGFSAVPLTIMAVLIGILYLHACCILKKKVSKAVHVQCNKNNASDCNFHASQVDNSMKTPKQLQTFDLVQNERTPTLEEPACNRSRISEKVSHEAFLQDRPEVSEQNKPGISTHIIPEDTSRDISKDSSPNKSTTNKRKGTETMELFPTKISVVSNEISSAKGASQNMSSHIASTTRQGNNVKENWKQKVFVTCLILAVQTLTLTIPGIFVSWYEVFSDNRMSNQTKFMFAIPYILNSLSNPCVLAWRVQEIRQEFKRVFKKCIPQIHPQ